MNNMKYFPFERNNYYSGKPLSVGSFETEQKYVNDKRRLINRFALGSGVMCGLDAVAVSDESISVEAGVAVDGAGREIVVDAPDVKRLSSITGYGADTAEYYLYIRYNEKITDKASGGDRVAEGYSLYLEDRPPALDTRNVYSYYEHNEKVFSSEKGDVYLTIPKFIRASDKFVLRVKVFPSDPDEEFHLNMTIALKCVRYNGRDRINVDFDSRTLRDVDGSFELCYYLDAMNIVQDMAEFAVRAGELTVRAGNEKFSGSKDIVIESVLTDRLISDSACENHRLQIMSYVKHRPFIDICLARIKAVRGKITEVRDFPFGQRLNTNPQLAIESKAIKDRLCILEEKFGGHIESDTSKEYEDGFEFASGEAVIDLGIGGRMGKRFFSESIAHGLGLGNVTIVLGMKQGNTGGVVFGSSEIFDEDYKGVKAELAARLEPDKGTFVIGLRLLEQTSEYEAVVCWSAIKRRETQRLDGSRRIILDCGAKSLKPMESSYFTVSFVNMAEADIRWSVDTPDGGTINDNGCYTAPNHAGVFKITAVCVSDNTVYASAYVVVKP